MYRERARNVKRSDRQRHGETETREPDRQDDRETVRQ